MYALQSSETLQTVDRQQFLADAETSTKRSGAKPKSKSNVDVEVGKADDVQLPVLSLVLNAESLRALLHYSSLSMRAKA